MEIIKRMASMLDEGDKICLGWIDEEGDGVYAFSGVVTDNVGTSLVQNFGRDDKYAAAVRIRPNSIEDGGDAWAMDGFWFFVPECEYTAQPVAVAQGNEDEVNIACWGEDKEEVVRVLNEWIERKEKRRKAE